MKLKKILAFFLVIVICIAFFMGTAFVFSRKVLLGVDVPKNDVPYEDGKYLPNDTTVLFTFADKPSVAVQILFSKKFTNVLLLDSFDLEDFAKHGFKIDHTVECDYSFLMKFIDTLGGIELENHDYVLTGVQVCNLLSIGEEKNTETKIIESVLNKISKNGLSEELIYCIIDNTITSLSAPVCYNWNVWVGESVISYNIVDGRQKLDSNY
jgi:hypothetical protein